MQHLLIEGYCDGKKGEDAYPCKGTLTLGIHCLKCPLFSYAECPNEIALSGKDGVIEKQEDFIGFGGEMEPEDIERRDKYIAIWNDICRKKMNEAYNEYMNYISSQSRLAPGQLPSMEGSPGGELAAKPTERCFADGRNQLDVSLDSRLFL